MGVIQERRDLSSIGCGVFVLCALLQCACRTAVPTADTATGPVVLTVGVPEANAPGEDLGVGHLRKILNYESLTLNGLDGRALPRIAEKWWWENNDLTLRIALRPSVFIHDNRPFAGQTAVDLVTAAVRDEGNLARYPSFADIESINSSSDLELSVHLKRPSAMLPEDLTVPLDIGGDGTGTGPFRIANAGDTSLDRFDRYYVGKPTIDRIVVRTFDALRTAWASLLRGELDMLYDVPADALEFVRNDDVEVISVPRWYQYHLAFNARDGALKSPSVRKAMNIAIDRVRIVKNVLYGTAETSSGPVYPKYWAYDATVPAYTYDPVEAAALLDAAGYRLPKNAEGDRPPARLRFTCILPENFAVWERVALEIQRDLINVGIDMQFKVVPFREFNTLIGSGKFDAAFLDMISGPTPARASIFWRSRKQFKGAYNVFGYENADAERLFETLLRSTNEAAIRSATSKLQRTFQEDPPAIFVAWSTRTRAVNRRFMIPNTGRDPILSVSQWTVTAPRKLAE